MSSSPSSIPEKQKAWLAVKRGTPAQAIRYDESVPLSSKLEPSQVLVKVQAAALNPVDYKILALMPNFMASRPHPMGGDFAGVIVASTDSKLAVGDEVFGTVWVPKQRKTRQGSLAEYVRVSSGSVIKRPKNITPTQAAGISLVGLTAAIGLFKYGQVEPGQNVFINGGSTAVGLSAIQIAKAIGCKVTATGSGPKEELLKSLGVDTFIDYTKGPVHGVLLQNPPEPKFHVIFETVGDIDTNLYTHSETYLAPGGNFVTVGPQPSGKGKVGQVARLLWAILRPAWLGGVNRKWRVFGVDESPEELERVAKLVEEGKFKPIVDSVYGFDNVLGAYDRLMTKRATGKVIVKVDPTVD